MDVTIDCYIIDYYLKFKRPKFFVKPIFKEKNKKILQPYYSISIQGASKTTILLAHTNYLSNCCYYVTIYYLYQVSRFYPI